MSIRGQSSITIAPNQTAQDQVTFPGPPPGFTAESRWGYPELATLGPNVSSMHVELIIPYQIDVAQCSVWMDDLKALLAGQGYTLADYEIDSETLVQVTIPSAIDFATPAGDATFQVPAQICVPFTNACVQVANQTILNVFS